MFINGKLELVSLRRFRRENRKVLTEKDQYRADATLFRDKLAKQRAISESLQTANQLKDEEYNKGVDVSLKDV